MDAVNFSTALVFTIASLAIALGMAALALGPLRDRGGPAGAHDHEEGGVPAPFAPDDGSPLGATDQTSDERSATGVARRGHEDGAG